MAAKALSHPLAEAGTYEFADDGYLATGAQRVLGQYLYCLAQPGDSAVPEARGLQLQHFQFASANARADRRLLTCAHSLTRLTR
jgi:hypothetical protein